MHFTVCTAAGSVGRAQAVPPSLTNPHFISPIPASLQPTAQSNMGKV